MTRPHKALGQRKGLNKEEFAANTLAKRGPRTRPPNTVQEREMLKTRWGPLEGFIYFGNIMHLL